jgi:hypothetical protein
MGSYLTFYLRSSPSGREPGRKACRQICSEDALLCGTEIVWRSTESHGSRVGVEQAEGSAPIAISGLSNRSWIDHVGGPGFELDGPRFCFRDACVLGIDCFSKARAQTKEPLDMRVAEEGDRDLRSRERADSILHIYNVAVFVVGRSMHKLHAGNIRQSDGPMRKLAQPRHVPGIEMVAVPQSREARHGVEVLDVVDSSDSLVMISPNEDLAETARPGCDFIGTGAIPDDITKIEYAIVRWRCRQAAFQGFEIAMYVAKQEYAHDRVRPARLGVPVWNWDYKALSPLVTGHLAQCDAPICSRGGRARRQSSTRMWQRGSNGHPAGSAFTGGTEPSMVCSGTARSDFNVGTACNNPRV